MLRQDRRATSWHAFADGLHEVPGWLESLGGETTPGDPGLLPSWPHFPGAGHVTYRRYSRRPARPRAVRLPARARSRRRGIEVRYDGRRADRLPPGPVVLAAGGFEYDAELRDTHLPLPLTAVGHPGNTGDAVRLAQQAGASLWHMSAFFGWFAFRHPDHVAAFPLDVHAPSFIYVDADGRRFADETGWEVHDKLRCLTTYLPRRAQPPAPARLHLVFDEPRAARRSAQRHRRHAQRLRLERRQLGRADGRLDPPRRGPRPPGARAHAAPPTAACPTRFGRAPETIVAFEPPLYAIEM